eukprot:Seg11372.1 transcript_id=Seg11372.1/GoldUCD/mRNA.D3Y31 product="Peroxisome biogenesis factor 2" protein_id=Seg11372.1/GoldUCD/D3Y31
MPVTREIDNLYRLKFMAKESKDEMTGLRALRIVQLDSAILDDEILLLFQSQLKNVFKYFERGTIKWQPEINAFIRFILWRFTIYKNSSSIGQSLFNVRYVIASEKGNVPITLKEKLILGAVYVGSNWLHERMDEIMNYLDQYHFSSKIRQFLKWFERCWQLASVLNFLVFLQSGIYPILLERFLRIRHVHNRKQKLKKNSFQFMNREILWHGYAEVIFYLVPFINIQRLKMKLNRILGLASYKPSDESKMISKEVKSKHCPKCNMKPTQPYIIPCGHVYCYYCIKTNCLADDAFKCSLCDLPVNNEIIPYQSIT